MIGNTALAGLLTILFAGGAVFVARQLLRSRTATTGTGHALHLAMAVCMIVMVWRTDWLLLPQVVLFAFATGWYGVRTLGQFARRSHRRGAVEAYQAGMMATMLLMLVAMRQWSGSAHGSGHGRGAVGLSPAWVATALPTVGWALVLAAAGWLAILAGQGAGRDGVLVRSRRVSAAAYEAVTALAMALMLLATH